MKNILKKVNLAPIARKMRSYGYWLSDLTGSLYFEALKCLGIILRHEQYDKKKISKILIIRTDRVGDLILSTPAIKAVRNSFQKAEIHLVISEYTKDLVLNNVNVNRILIHKKDLIDRDYDLAIALNPGIAQNRLAFKSGAKWRVGYTGLGGGFYLTHKLKDDRAKRIRHEVVSALELIGPIGCVEKDKILDISVSEEGERFAELFFQEHGIKRDMTVIIHPGARQEYIKWKKEGFAEVADELMGQDARIIITGSKDEEQLVKDTAALMKNNPICAVNLSLTQLISLIKKSHLFIGNSTGPMHIAAAVKVPVVAIFGAIHPLDSYQEWGPWGENNIVVSQNLDCPKCHPTDCKSFDCMRLITVDDVMKAVKSQLIFHKTAAEVKLAGIS